MVNWKVILVVVGVAAIATGWGFYIHQIGKTGEERERKRQLERSLEESADRQKFLEKELKEAELRERAADSFLLDALADVAKYASREQIYIDKIKIDSLLLKEIELEDAKNDSLSKHFNADDWNCYIARKVGENCN